MNIFIQIIGILMLVGFKFSHKSDGVSTDPGVYIFAIVYVLCATALIIIPIIFK